MHRIIIHRQNKSRLCLPIRASPVLWRHPFHLAQFQGCRESKATRLLRRPNSCNHGDLVANTPATRSRVLDRMVGISHQNLQMYPIRKKKNAERSKTAQPRRLAERRAPSAERLASSTSITVRERRPEKWDIFTAAPWPGKNLRVFLNKFSLTFHGAADLIRS